MKKLSVFKVLIFSMLSFSLHAQDYNSEIESDQAYQQANKDFELMLKAAQSVGEKECKSDAPRGEFARSAYLWFAKGKLLSDRERVRFGIYQSEVARIKKRMQVLLESKDKSNLQSEGILTLAELLTTDINFLWGKMGRIEIRRDFLVEIKNGSPAALYENKLWLESYEKDFIANLKKGLSIAKKACELKDEDKVEGCKEAQSQIEKVLSLAPEYVEKYSQKNLPSGELHDDLIAVEDKLTKAVNAIAQGAKNYEWKIPAIKGLEKIIEVRKKVNVFCPESKESKSQEKAVKIAEIFNDKNKPDDVKKTEMLKIDESLANSLIGGALSVAELKAIPVEWDRQNNLIGLGESRDPLMSEIVQKVENLMSLDQKKYELIKEKREKVYKMLLAMGDLSKSKLDLEAECGKDPYPGTSVCPGRTVNPLCDMNSPESFKKEDFKACRYRVEVQNDMISKLATADNSIRTDPDVVGVESYYIGMTGPLWRAIVKNPDGTTGHKDLVKFVDPYSGGSSFGGVQNDPGNKRPKPIEDENIIPTTSKSGSASSGGSGGSGSSGNVANDKTKIAETNKPPSENKLTMTNADQKIFEKYETILQTKAEKTPASISVVCGASPCKKQTTEPNSLCTVDEADKAQWKEYSLCQSAVNEHNEKLDAGINLSSYVKNHPDFIGIARHPKNGLWVAKMQNGRRVYYLPINAIDGI